MIPQKAIDLVKHFEGLRLKAYKDIVGVLTIGYGHVNTTPPHVTDGMVITESEAEQFLANDLDHVIQCLCNFVTVPLNSDQTSALASFCFNLGLGAFKSSTLLKKLNSSDYDSAAKEILRWDKAGGKVLPGLTKRRQAEYVLFTTGVLNVT
jgi:lysozyme